MTVDEYKQMVSGIINNDEHWTYKSPEDDEWKYVSITDGFSPDYEYKLVTWYYVMNVNNQYMVTEDKSQMEGYECVFSGSEQECIEWISSHRPPLTCNERNTVNELFYTFCCDLMAEISKFTVPITVGENKANYISESNLQSVISELVKSKIEYILSN